MDNQQSQPVALPVGQSPAATPNHGATFQDIRQNWLNQSTTPQHSATAAYSEQPAAQQYAYYPTLDQHDAQFSQRLMSGGASTLVAGITGFFLLCFIIGALSTHVPFVAIALVLGIGLFVMLEIYGIVTFVRGMLVHSPRQITSGAIIVVTCIALPVIFYLMVIASLLNSTYTNYPNLYNPYGG